MTEQRRLYIIALAVAMAGFIFQMALQRAMRGYAFQGLYFQGWSSESLTQTLPIEDLRDAPLETLWNIHIEPPGFDAIRAVLVAMSPGKEIHAALRDVDARLNVLWAVIYALMGALVFLWTTQLTRMWVGLTLAAAYLLHPGSIFYTTLLDPTILTTFLILCLYYLLWRAKFGSGKAIGALAAVTVVLFFTKSIFQLPVILLMAFCLLLLRAPRRPLLIFVAITAGIAVLYTVKQFAMFHIVTTSSWASYNLCKSIGIDNHYTVHLDLEARDDAGLPSVLRRDSKLTGPINYNNINFLDWSNYLSHKYVKYLLTFPVRSLAENYRQNLELYWRPSSKYAREVNVIVERLPWRRVFDTIFSWPVFPLALLAAGVYATVRAVQRKELRVLLALLLPGLAIFVISVIGDKGENMRYKYFMEPVYMIFVTWAAYEAYHRLVRGQRAAE